jgi:hypothetical protein
MIVKYLWLTPENNLKVLLLTVSYRIYIDKFLTNKRVCYNNSNNLQRVLKGFYNGKRTLI